MTPTHPPIPVTPDDLSLGWLIAALEFSGSDSMIQPIGMTKTSIGEGLSTSGVLTRLNLKYESPQPDAVSTLIVKTPMHPSNPNGASVRKQGTYPREIRFYRELAAECPLVTPEFYYGRHDPDSGDAVLIIEDLASSRPDDNAVGCSDDEALEIIGELGKLHAHFWEANDRADLHWLRGDGISDRVANFFEQRWTDGRSAMADKVPEELFALGDRYFEDSGLLIWIDEPPVTLFHGDFRLDNMYFSDGDSLPITFADFQRIGVGRGVIDFAVFALSALSVDQRRAIENDLLATYHRRLVDGGVEHYSKDDLWFDYRRSVGFVAIRTLVAMLIFTDSAFNRNDALLQTTTAVEDLKAIDALG